MRFLLAALLIALLAYVAGLFLPWWALAIVAFGVALLVPQSGWAAFGSGFTGIFVLWAVLAFWIDSKNDSLLSQKVAELLPLGGSSFLLALVSAFVGALVGGFAALSGGLLRNLFSTQAGR